jgi:hypothetical protein
VKTFLKVVFVVIGIVLTVLNIQSNREARRILRENDGD